MDLLTTAIIAGAAAGRADSAQDSIKTASQALQQAVSRWFGSKLEAQAALQQVVQHPADAQAQQALEMNILVQQQCTVPADDLLQLVTALVQAIQQYGQRQDQPRIGILIEALKTKGLKFGHAQPSRKLASSGIAAKPAP